jgi:hypothetical protein
MAPTKSIDKTNALKGAIPDPTIWTFVHAAVVASVVIATLLLVVFSVMAFGDHRGVFQLGLSLIPFATLVIWSSAAVLYLGFRATELLKTLKPLIRHARTSPSGKSGMWDDWLDIPEPHHP